MNNQQAWILAFIQIVAIKEHPANKIGADLEACADLADEMLDIIKDRCPYVEEKCQSSRA